MGEGSTHCSRVSGRIRTHNPSKRAAAQLGLRQRSHRDRHQITSRKIDPISSLRNVNTLDIYLEERNNLLKYTTIFL